MDGLGVLPGAGVERVTGSEVGGTALAVPLDACGGRGFTWVQASKEKKIKNPMLILRCINNS